MSYTSPGCVRFSIYSVFESLTHNCGTKVPKASSSLPSSKCAIPMASRWFGPKKAIGETALDQRKPLDSQFTELITYIVITGSLNNVYLASQLLRVEVCHPPERPRLHWPRGIGGTYAVQSHEKKRGQMSAKMWIEVCLQIGL